MTDRIQVYTDGGCRGNHEKENLGAWAYSMSYKGFTREKAVAVRNTTNNQQELMAVIKALRAIRTTDVGIDVYTDSAYVCNGISSWIKNWKAKGWKTASKKPVKNKELWVELDELVGRQNDIKFFQVKGHSDNEGNNRVDLLLNQAMDEEIANE